MNPKRVSPVVAELRELRRGRGLDSPDVHLLAGPVLRAACGVLDTDRPAQVRDKLALGLAELSRKLPRDLELAVLAALGLHKEASGQFLDQRMAWLAAQFDRDPRTARRRLDRALELLAQYVEVHTGRTDLAGPYEPARWYTDRLEAVLRLDLATPKLVETRSIVATVDELDEIAVSVSAPGGADDRIDAEMVYGGEIVEREPVSHSHCRFMVRLPVPLGVGNRHEYSIEFSGRPRAQMRPYYVLTPYSRCDSFSLRVRFGAQVPSLIWRVRDMPARALDDFCPGEDQVSADSVGDVHQEFMHLQQGLSYGLQWRERAEPGNGADG